ncbi:MAG TPA: HEAT repeat domain-containing protein, partial [Pyrinomonadaceae bacterium]|nr:HEAT repeat domain-containing protein [Pyrinomonadaceae bacterium]
MKNVLPANNAAERYAVRGHLRSRAGKRGTPRRRKVLRALCLGILLLGVALMPTISPFAQKRKEGGYSLTDVSSRKTGDGTVVTVSADAPLTRTQTWQDDEGFHMTLPNASPGSVKGLPRGVTVRNLGKSLELVVAVKPGAGVTVDPQSNRLNLIVRGGVDTSRGEAQLEPPRSAQPAEQSVYEPPVRQPRERRPLSDAAPAETYSTRGQDFSAPMPPVKGEAANTPASNGATPTASPLASPQPGASPVATPVQIVPSTDPGITPAGSDPAAQAAAPPSAITVSNTEGGGITSYIFSATGVAIILLLGVVALVVVRKRQAAEGQTEKEEKSKQKDSKVELVPLNEVTALEERPRKERRKLSRRKSDQALAKAGAATKAEAESRAEEELERRPVVMPVQPALFGAYRVDQEVGKLVLGQAHRLDVLSSRAPDDRRALETSLVKAMNSAEAGEDGRRRARGALEEYGFVARQCASLLLAHNAYDRASSARVLGEIGSQASLPFLLEALYDTEMIVRTEAVTSLGSLKMPSAIGALLDMARRHPEMPAALISNALTACSVECFDIFDASTPDRPLLEAGGADMFMGEITHLDSVAAVEALPEWFEDEELSEALSRLQDADVEARAAAARRLAQFSVQRAVEALTVLASDDPEATVRAAAVGSLGEIEHESVFAPVLMAFADEAREVRAAAARSLSRMSLDRAEGYVRLIETAEPETLAKVAVACSKAGMVAQAVERLISEDRRLAYEAFSLLSLLAKANETEPLLDAITNHPEENVRLALIRLLGTTGQPA